MEAFKILKVFSKLIKFKLLKNNNNGLKKKRFIKKVKYINLLILCKKNFVLIK